MKINFIRPWHIIYIIYTFVVRTYIKYTHTPIRMYIKIKYIYVVKIFYIC